MCHYFEITYTCKHSDVFEGACEWRDEGMVDEHGENYACTKSCSTEPDLERVCMACFDKAEQDLSKNQITTIEIMVRNEAFLRKRARRRGLPKPGPTQGFITLSQYELEVQFRVNVEFLSRRHKRRCFQRYLDSADITYQDFLEAADAHREAKTVLENTVPVVQDHDEGTQPQSSQAVAGQGNHENQGANVQQAEIIDAEYGIGQEWWDVLNLGVDRGDDYREDSDSSSGSDSGEFPPRPLNPARRWGNDNNLDESQPRLDDQGDDCGNAVSTGDPQPDDTPAQSRREVSRDPDEQGTSSSNSSTISSNRVALNSPEGISRLAECRKFFGMPPDTSPAQLFDVLARDEVLQDSIAENLIPPHHHPKKASQRQNFAIEARPSLAIKIENKNWQFRESFVHAWNSLDWPSRHKIEEILIETTMAATRPFVNSAGIQQRPPYLPSVLSPLGISHTYAEPRAPPNEVSHFSDSSSSFSDSSDDASEDSYANANDAPGLELRWTLYNAQQNQEHAMQENVATDSDSDSDSDEEVEVEVEEQLKKRGIRRDEEREEERSVVPRKFEVEEPCAWL